MKIEKEQQLIHVLTFLRIVVSLLLIVHGVARIYLGIVDDFGEFLTFSYFPLGFYIAWGITIFEIVGGILMAIGFWIKPISLVFSLQLLCGIFLVHLKEGWFVVGAGRNGIEYSVLLIAICLALAYSNINKTSEE